MAQLYHIPARFMTPEYPQTPDTIARAKADRDEELRRVHSIDVLDRMVKLHGAERVHVWLITVAGLNGQSTPCELRSAS